MSDTRTYYYARVSSRDQNLARQLEAFRVLGADERSIITDRESGKDLNRPGYMALKNTILRPGDTLVITSLDRLSRRKADIETELLWFREQHIRLKILDLPTTMTDFPAGQEWVADMVNNIIIEVLGYHGRAGATPHPAASGGGLRSSQSSRSQDGTAQTGPASSVAGDLRSVAGRGAYRQGGCSASGNRKIYLLQAGQRKIMVGRQPALHTRKSQTAQGFQPSARLAFAANLKL